MPLEPLAREADGSGPVADVGQAIERNFALFKDTYYSMPDRRPADFCCLSTSMIRSVWDRCTVLLRHLEPHTLGWGHWARRCRI